MIELTLQQLVGQAARLGGGDLCAAGHDWVSSGGRLCPRGDPMGGGRCSQTVYECARCGWEDYGEPGGPAYRECYTLGPCDESCSREPQPAERQ
jgi:hypothetical protein